MQPSRIIFQKLLSFFLSNFLIDSTVAMNCPLNLRITKNIIAERVNIAKKEWILSNAIVTELDNSSIKYEKIEFLTNFDLERISNLFSDLTSLTYFDLLALEDDYKAIGAVVELARWELSKFKHSIDKFGDTEYWALKETGIPN